MLKGVQTQWQLSPGDKQANSLKVIKCHTFDLFLLLTL